MLDKVKLALRITHTLLDDELNDEIATARAEMVRAGVDSAIAESDLDIVQTAIKTYCLMMNAKDTKDADAYEKSWQYQLDNIRKSSLEV